MSKTVEVKIIDDTKWEPDEDFFILLKASSGENLLGCDTRTRVTIIDDDKPSPFAFARAEYNV